jgi:hypothetical protein
MPSGALADWLSPVSLASPSWADFATRQRHDLVRVHPDVRSAAEGIDRQASSGAFSGLANPGVISGQLERDRGMRQQT